MEDEVDIPGYEILGNLGQGTFSKVYKGRNISTQKECAIKVMKNKFHKIDEVERLREVQALRRLSSHPGIIQLRDVVFEQEKGRLSLVFELMTMNFYEYLSSRKRKVSQSRVRNFMYQLLKALEFTHSNGIFHRDIKPENILVQGDKLKIADFGSCRGKFSKKPFTEYISTRWYRAPECLLTDGYYDAKMDIWGVGCVMYELITSNPLFPGEDELDQAKQIHRILGSPTPAVLDKFKKHAQNHNIRFSFPYRKGKGLRKILPKNCKQDCVDLMSKLLIYDPDKRISAKRALNHIYFGGMKRSKSKSRKEKKGSAKSSHRSPFYSPKIQPKRHSEYMVGGLPEVCLHPGLRRHSSRDKPQIMNMNVVGDLNFNVNWNSTSTGVHQFIRESLEKISTKEKLMKYKKNKKKPLQNSSKKKRVKSKTDSRSLNINLKKGKISSRKKLKQQFNGSGGNFLPPVFTRKSVDITKKSKTKKKKKRKSVNNYQLTGNRIVLK